MSKPVEGYLDKAAYGGVLSDPRGKLTRWHFYAKAHDYANHWGDRTTAVVLAKPDRKGEPTFASGYWLGPDAGDLFRGSESGQDLGEALREAKAESEYWGRLDAESDEGAEGDDQ